MDGATTNPFLLSLLADFSLSNPILPPGKPQSYPRSRAELLGKTFERATTLHLKKQREHMERSGLTDKALLCAAALALYILKEDRARLVEMETLLKQVWTSVEERDRLETLAKAFLEVHLVDYDENKGYRFVHDSLLDYGLALGAVSQNPNAAPAYAFSNGQFDAFLGDWVGVHPAPNTAAKQVLEQCQRFGCPEKLIDVAIANRGILDAETLENLWWAIGVGLLSTRHIITRVADSLGSLPRRLAAEALRYKVLRPLEQVNSWMADKAENALLDGKFTGHSLVKFRHEFNRQHKLSLHLATTDNTSKAPRVEPYEAPASSLKQLEQQLEKTGNESKRRHLVMSAAKPGFKVALPLLTEILRIDSYASVRGSAANALGRIGDRSAVPALGEALLDKEAREDIRGSAATALGQIGDRSAVPALSEALLDKEASDGIRGSAATALCHITGTLEPWMFDIAKTRSRQDNRIGSPLWHPSGRI